MERSGGGDFWSVPNVGGVRSIELDSQQFSVYAIEEDNQRVHEIIVRQGIKIVDKGRGQTSIKSDVEAKEKLLSNSIAGDKQEGYFNKIALDIAGGDIFAYE